jgi:hypothetical protein
MLSLLATLFLTVPSAQALTLNVGRCVPLDPTNPAYQVLCERFDQNPTGCETQRHICYWKSQSPFLKIDTEVSTESSLIARSLSRK